jgi:hypothetical protein
MAASDVDARARQLTNDRCLALDASSPTLGDAEYGNPG